MNPIERAFELARSGDYSNMEDLKRRLRQEGYMAVDQYLSGKGIKDQLHALMRGVRSKGPNPPAETY